LIFFLSWAVGRRHGVFGVSCVHFFSPYRWRIYLILLVDVAAREKDPLRRIAFVAAFAMSNYSSTIGRIAKPFNPMLVCFRLNFQSLLINVCFVILQSETFEYVRLDRQYRYVSEQVSHHPPISACWAESPAWHYYGEVGFTSLFAPSVNLKL
jgi:hypothetical protein